MKYKLYQPQAINELGNRKNQEDTVFPAFGSATPDSRLFLVCDGMGGYARGEVASATVSKAVSDYINGRHDFDTPLDDQVFAAALGSAYDALDQADHEEENKMGTTLTMICLHQGGCLAAHIGDRRIYHLRPSTGEILYRSRDHSLVQQLYEMGEIGYWEMKTSPKKNIVMRAMQPHQETRAKAELVHITDIRPGDYFYMCTDGMLEKMEDDELMSIIGDKDVDDEQKCQRLKEATAGNADNHSAYLIHIARVENEESDALQPNDEPQARAANKALNDPDRFNKPADKEPDVEMISQGPTAQPQETVRPAAVRKQAVPKKSGSKKLLVPFIILLVAVLTGFTIFNLLGSKKEVPDKMVEPQNTEESDRIEFKKSDTKEESGTTTPFPSRQATPKKSITTRDEQSERTDREYNELLQNEKRRQQKRIEQEKAEKAKKEKEEAEEAQRKAKEAAEKAAQATQQAAEKAKAAAEKDAASKTTLHVGDNGNVKVDKPATQGQSESPAKSAKPTGKPLKGSTKE